MIFVLKTYHFLFNTSVTWWFLTKLPSEYFKRSDFIVWHLPRCRELHLFRHSNNNKLCFRT